jgi:1-hydroxycarotenoid 3,4-desaturase
MRATAEGFPLLRHNVFFGADYAAEFAAVFHQNRLPADPTVYVCAQDRHEDEGPGAPERLLCLVNAPPTGDSRPPTEPEMDQCQATMTARLARCGLALLPTGSVRTGPAEWERLFPATGGALYGPAQHGWRASFSRPGARSRMAGLYLAGGSAHPGPGVPMAALSGRFAAAAMLSDLGSTSRSRPGGMSGGTSTRSPRTVTASP